MVAVGLLVVEEIVKVVAILQNIDSTSIHEAFSAKPIWSMMKL